MNRLCHCEKVVTARKMRFLLKYDGGFRVEQSKPREHTFFNPSFWGSSSVPILRDNWVQPHPAGSLLPRDNVALWYL